MELSKILQDRGEQYGSFYENGTVSQELKEIMRSTDNWAKLLPDQREALEMISHKAARILNGDPDHLDSWSDIAGYAQLVADRLAANDGCPGCAMCDTQGDSEKEIVSQKKVKKALRTLMRAGVIAEL